MKIECISQIIWTEIRKTHSKDGKSGRFCSNCENKQNRFICQKKLFLQLLTSTLVWVHFQWILVESGTHCWCLDWTGAQKFEHYTRHLGEIYHKYGQSMFFGRIVHVFFMAEINFSWNFFVGCFFLLLSPVWSWYRMKLWLLFDWKRWKWHGAKFGNTINLVFRSRFVRSIGCHQLIWHKWKNHGCLFYG